MNGRAPKATPDAGASVGDRVVAMRTEGKSYAAIAKATGMGRSLDVFQLFVDTIAARPARERARLRTEENRRLDAIERRTAKLTDEAVRNRRQESLKKLRARLIAIA